METAARRRTDATRVAGIYFGLGEALSIKWLRVNLELLDVVGQWHALSRSNLRGELFAAHNRLVEAVLAEAGRSKNPLGDWMERHAPAIAPVQKMLKQMKSDAEMDYPTISVAVRALDHLVEETVND